MISKCSLFFIRSVQLSSRETWSLVRQVSTTSSLDRGKSYNQKFMKDVKERKERTKRLLEAKARNQMTKITSFPQVSISDISNLTGRRQDLVRFAVGQVLQRDMRQINPNLKLQEVSIIREVFLKLGFRWQPKYDDGPDENEKEKLEFELLQLLTDATEPTKAEKLKPRKGIIAMLGHIDHGKTSLLDQLRQSSIVDTESGGITQKITAFSYKTSDVAADDMFGSFTFVDVPGHAAFSSMRIRGTRLTDVVVLVVASDDGVMEQTVESIKMIKNSNAPFVVAINKCDLKSSNPKQTMIELAEHGVVCEPLGGDIQCENISAKTGYGVRELMEKVAMEIEMLDLKSDENRPVDGVVVESHMSQHLGFLATCIIKHGVLKKGQFLVCGSNYARVKALLNENGKNNKAIHPSEVVHISGWKNKNLIESGEQIIQVENESIAKKIVEMRQRLKQLDHLEDVESTVSATRAQYKKLYTEQRGSSHRKSAKSYNFYKKLNKLMEKEDVPVYNILVKADTIGSLEVLNSLLGSYDNTDHEVQLNVIMSSIGDITESEIERAAVGQASVYLFNLDASKATKEACKERDVEIHPFSVIYHLFDHLKETITELITPKFEFVSQGQATIEKIFQYKTNEGKMTICGSVVTQGIISKDSNYQLLFNDEVVDEGVIHSIKQTTLDVEEIKYPNECGIQLKSSMTDDVIPPREGYVIVCGENSLMEKELDWKPDGF